MENSFDMVSDFLDHLTNINHAWYTRATKVVGGSSLRTLSRGKIKKEYERDEIMAQWVNQKVKLIKHVMRMGSKNVNVVRDRQGNPNEKNATKLIMKRPTL